MEIVQAIVRRTRPSRMFGATQFIDPIKCQKDELSFLHSAMVMLEDLVGNLHVANREQIAAGILGYLSTDIYLHFEDLDALAAMVEAKRRDNLRIDVPNDRMRSDCYAMDCLLPSIREGLLALVNHTLPDRPETFVISSLMLVEFARLHINFINYDFLERVASELIAGELADLGREMALRRGLGAIH